MEAGDLEQRITRLFSTLVRETRGELSLTAASVLGALGDGPRRVTELADAQAVAQPTMTVLVGRLEGRGLVERRADATDRRATAVHLTDAGRDALARRRAARAEVLARRLDRLERAERDAIAAALPAFDRLLEQP